jgi:hypothetical protein
MTVSERFMVGSQSTPFIGNFDGNNHTVTLNINSSVSSDKKVENLICAMSNKNRCFSSIRGVVDDKSQVPLVIKISKQLCVRHNNLYKFTQ